MKVAEKPGLNLIRTEDIERARVRLEDASAEYEAAGAQYREALAVPSEERSEWIGDLVVASHASSNAPRYRMEPAAYRALEAAARQVIAHFDTMRGVTL